MSLLTIVSNTSLRLGLGPVAAVQGSLDATVNQLQGILFALGEEISREHLWRAQVRTATWSAVAGEDQGTIVSRTGPDFRRFLPETFYNQTTDFQVLGPLSDQEWQAVHAVNASSTQPYFQLAGGRIYVWPAPSAGDTLTVRWQSSYWITDSTGSTFKENFTQDSDRTIFDEHLLSVGLQARWLRAKGLPFENFEVEYQALLLRAKSQDSPQPVLDLAGPSRKVSPGILVPRGNWSVP